MIASVMAVAQFLFFESDRRFGSYMSLPEIGGASQQSKTRPNAESI